MKCDNNLCIYNEKEKCILTEISVDGMGTCSECIYPDIEEGILLQAKLRTLKSLEKDFY